MPTFTNTGMNSKLTKDAMRGANPEGFNPVVNGRMLRSPLRRLYIHSVAKRSFTLRQPPLFPRLELRGCINGERYVTASSFPDPIPQISYDDARGGNRVDDNDAWICLIDLLRPGNFTMDPYSGSDNPDYYANRMKTNYIVEGLFPSENEVPTEDELKQAEKVRDRRYRWLAQEASRLAAVSTKSLNEFLEINPEVHIAMDVLGMVAPWHSKNEVRVDCPNCGDPIKQGIALHMSTAGVRCVIDWRQAYENGSIKKDEVPPGKRWAGFGKIEE